MDDKQVQQFAIDKTDRYPSIQTVLVGVFLLHEFYYLDLLCCVDIIFYTNANLPDNVNHNLQTYSTIK